MQEEVSTKTVALVVRATKLTADVLVKAIKMYINHHKKLEAQKKAAKNDMKHGKVSVKELMGKDAGASSIEISDDNIRSFEHTARKYNVDFAVKKDKTMDPPKYIIFFKARDTDVISQAFKEYVHRNEERAKKPSLKQRLDRYAAIARKTARREIAKDHNESREQSL